MDLVESNIHFEELTSRHPWELSRLKVISSIVRKCYQDKKQDNLVVFDIGCGDTFIAENLSLQYPQITFYAIDTQFTDEQLAGYRKKYDRLGQKIHIYRTIEESSLNCPQEVSMVLLLDVVEHIENDEGFLRDLSEQQIVGKDTLLLLTVPAFQSLFCSHDVFLKHFRRYNLSRFSALLSRSGYCVETKGYFFSTLLVIRMLKVIKEKLFKPEASYGVGNWNGNKIIGKVIAEMLSIDYFLTSQLRKMRIYFPGLSIYSVCKKRV
ncbi:MAG: hypothetical protein HXX13_10420 [Bacteroidetes bacterium]|nr:hypothetical protein [Bacteroidota bacterium]